MINFSKKLGNYTHFFNYPAFLQIKDKLCQDAYYKALRGLCNYFEERYLDNEELVTEINKIRHIAKKPSCNADIYTPTDKELLDNLNRIKELNQSIYLFYLGLIFSGVRIRELETYIKNPADFRVVEKEGFYKIVLNSNRITKKCYYIYLPTNFKLPERFSVKYLSKFLTEHKEVIRPKYIRNWFYSKCLDLGIPNGIVDFYQGRAAITVGDKHYLDKERMADHLYGKLVDYFREKIYII